MATLISNADGNLTGASTFAAVETGAGALALIRSASGNSVLDNSNTSSPAFTVTNGSVIDGVLLWCKNSSATPSGTFLVELQKGGVTQASVTVNRIDLPASTTTLNSPVFFKFTSTATGDGGANWTIKITLNSGSGNVSFINASATTFDITRALRLTTAATAAAGDNLYIIGELTGAGTSNTRTVTMNSTAATAYGSGVVNSTSVSGGGIYIGNLGILTYGTTASTNYVLRVNGDLWVYYGGTLNIGANGAEIPRTSTAVLEFQPTSADGDFGLRGEDGATINIYGLSRTSGRNIVKCKLDATAPTSPNLMTSTGLTGLQGFNSTQALTTAASTTALCPDNLTILTVSCTDTTATASHSTYVTVSSIVTNTTQVFVVHLKQGSGTNNRYVRIQLGSSSGTTSPPTNGFYADIDLQAGTIGSCTAAGSGTATSSAIESIGNGWYKCSIIGKISSSSASPISVIFACSAAGTTSYTGDATQNFLYYSPQVYTASALPSSTLTVDTDTGWLNGDVIVLASTDRTYTNCESNFLNSGATATTLPCAMTLYASHSGTSPTQAEVILVTRNVKIRSTSSTLMAYVIMSSLATCTVQWCEFYYLGSNTTGKRGIEINAGTNASAKNISYCSIHNTESGALYLASGGTNVNINVNFSNNVMWNVATGSGNGININTSIATGDWKIDNNVLIRCANLLVSLSDVGGTFTNNVCAGSASHGVSLAENLGIIGIFSGNICHSNGSSGLNFGNAQIVGTVDSFICYRNASYGINFSTITYGCEIIFSSPVIFGNQSGNFQIQGGVAVWLTSPIMAADSTFATTQNFQIYSGTIIIDSGQLSVASGIYTACTYEFNISIASPNIICRNTIMGAATELYLSSATYGMGDFAYMSSEKHDRTAGNHKTWLRSGVLSTDTTIYKTASPSMRMTPSSAFSYTCTTTSGSPTLTAGTATNIASIKAGQLVVGTNIASGSTVSSSNLMLNTVTLSLNATASGTAQTISFCAKLPSAPLGLGMKVGVLSGASVTIAVYTRKSVVGDGAAYNGQQPRLMLRANPAIGIESDTVIATHSAAAGTWQQINGTTATATDDGVMEFYVDCDGTTGWVNVDDWSI